MVLAAIVFAESGLLVGFFLPGDSLLFFAGFLASSRRAAHVCRAAAGRRCWSRSLAAIAGDQVGYLFGRRVGPTLFHRPQSRLFNPANVVKAQAFFESTARRRSCWPASCRSCARSPRSSPASARCTTARSSPTTSIGGLLWGVGVTTLGYFLGKIEFIKNNIEIAAIIIVLISVPPMIIEYIRHRRRGARNGRPLDESVLPLD